jgi:hypothetical protein
MEQLFQPNLDSYRTHEDAANYIKHSLGYSLYLRKINETFRETTLIGLLTKYLEAIAQIQLPDLIQGIQENPRFQSMIRSHLQIVKTMIHSPDFIEERMRLPTGYLPAFLKVCSHFE